MQQKNPLNELLIKTIRDDSLDDQKRSAIISGLIQDIPVAAEQESKLHAIYQKNFPNQNFEIASVDGREKEFNNTALMCAVVEGRTETVKQLIDADANLDLHNKDGDTALHCATYQGHLPSVEALIEKKANLQIYNNNRNTALDKAICNTGSNRDISPAVKLAIVSLLLNAGARFNHPNRLFEFLQSCNQADPKVLTSLEKFCELTNPTEDKQSSYSELPSYLIKLRGVHDVLKNSVPLPDDLLRIILDYRPLSNTFLKPNDIERLYESYTNPPEPLGELKLNSAQPSQPVANSSNARKDEDARDARNGIVLFGMATTFGLAITFITGFMAKDPLNDTLVFTLLLCAEIMVTLFLGTVTALMISDLSHAEQPQPSL